MGLSNPSVILNEPSLANPLFWPDCVAYRHQWPTLCSSPSILRNRTEIGCMLSSTDSFDSHSWDLRGVPTISEPSFSHFRRRHSGQIHSGRGRQDDWVTPRNSEFCSMVKSTSEFHTRVSVSRWRDVMKRRLSVLQKGKTNEGLTGARFLIVWFPSARTQLIRRPSIDWHWDADRVLSKWSWHHPKYFYHNRPITSHTETIALYSFSVFLRSPWPSSALLLHCRQDSWIFLKPDSSVNFCCHLVLIYLQSRSFISFFRCFVGVLVKEMTSSQSDFPAGALHSTQNSGQRDRFRICNTWPLEAARPIWRHSCYVFWCCVTDQDLPLQTPGRWPKIRGLTSKMPSLRRRAAEPESDVTQFLLTAPAISDNSWCRRSISWSSSVQPRAPSAYQVLPAPQEDLAP